MVSGFDLGLGLVMRKKKYCWCRKKKDWVDLLGLEGEVAVKVGSGWVLGCSTLVVGFGL